MKGLPIGSSIAVGLRIVQTMIGALLAVALARTLGPRDYGFYSYALALIFLMATPVRFGLPELLVRELAASHVNSAWGRLRGVLRWTLGVSVGVSVAVIGLTLVLVLWFRIGRNSVDVLTLYWGLALLPLLVLCSMRGAALRGLGLAIPGQLAEQALRPTILLCAVIVAASIVRVDLSAEQVMALHVGAAGVALLFGQVLLYRSTPPESKRVEPVYETRRWAMSAGPLALIAGLQFINTNADVVMIGALVDAKAVGIYRAVSQGAALVTLGLVAVNLVVAPQIARLWTRQQLADLQGLMVQSARAVLAMGAPIALALMLLGRPILRFAFGPEFSAGVAPLAILAAGQVFNCATGLVGSLLIMTGHERDVVFRVSVAAILNVGLNLLLIPAFGLAGAALATSTTYVVWNVLLWLLVHRRVGVDASALGRFVLNRSRGE